MIRSILAVAGIAAALAVSPVMAQQETPAPESPKTQPETQPVPPKEQLSPLDPSIVGLAVYSSDGQKVGEVVEIGMAGGTHAIRVEMGEFLGLGTSSVVVNANAIERKGDRVEIAMSADEIKQTIERQRGKQQQQQQQQ